MTKINILRNGELDLSLLSTLVQKPALFSPGEPLFWNDPHISKQMLDAHLNPNWDAASRRPELIDQIVSWIAKQLPMGHGASLLDLGCGPGLYCARLDRLGYHVTGVDYSQRSIDYARQTAAANQQAIEYLYQDYLTLDLHQRFDAAILVYYDLGVLADPDRDNLLQRVHQALKPGGYFIFDLLTPLGRAEQSVLDWQVKPHGGFWRPGPHMVLSRTFAYPDASAFVDQYIVIEPTGDVDIYRIWEHGYTPETITPVLEAQGFAVAGIWADLTGQEHHPDAKTMAIIARKRD